MEPESFFEIYKELPKTLEEIKEEVKSKSSLLEFIQENPGKISDFNREKNSLVNLLNSLNMQISDIKIVLEFINSLKDKNSALCFISETGNYTKNPKKFLKYDCKNCGNKHPIIISPANGSFEQRYVICNNKLYTI